MWLLPHRGQAHFSLFRIFDYFHTGARPISACFVYVITSTQGPGPFQPVSYMWLLPHRGQAHFSLFRACICDYFHTGTRPISANFIINWLGNWVSSRYQLYIMLLSMSHEKCTVLLFCFVLIISLEDSSDVYKCICIYGFFIGIWDNRCCCNL